MNFLNPRARKMNGSSLGNRFESWKVGKLEGWKVVKLAVGKTEG